ncbi:MAG: SprB repeat-containing protein, partial [Flavobacteriales bacterium]|nr:SprB repeat-containing protein [Flavobacteriales bacterium]
NGDCDGVSITTVTDNGGSTLFTYLWDNGQTTTSATGMCAGNYNLTVTDGNNCIVTESVLVLEPALLQLTVTGNSVCLGSSDGAVSSTISGGVTPYNYLWNNGITTPNQSGLGGGSYTVIITDNNSCLTAGSATITINPLPTANNVSDAICETVFGSLVVSGIDLTDYESTISGGGVAYTWFESDQNTLVANPNSVTIANSDNFYVVVSDGTCSDTALVNIDILQGFQLV